MDQRAYQIEQIDADEGAPATVGCNCPDGMSKAKTKPFDPAEYLEDSESIAAYLTDALESEDPTFVADALGVIARARGMSEVASKTGLSRESLYRALSADGNPEFATILRVVQALDLRLSAVPLPQKRSA